MKRKYAVVADEKHSAHTEVVVEFDAETDEHAARQAPGELKGKCAYPENLRLYRQVDVRIPSR